MTKAEKKRRIAELKARKDAIVWKFIGACNEINEQIDALRAICTEDDNEPCTEDQATADAEDQNGRHESLL